MLPVSPLWKVPLLVLSSACVHVAFTSPNPPPSKAEMEKYDAVKGDFSLQDPSPRAGPLSMKIGTHLFNAIEVYTILVSGLSPGLAAGAGAIRITPGYILALGWIVAMAAVRAACYRELGRHFTFELSFKNNHKLVTGGPYSIVRHPGYSACATYFGAALITQLGPGSWFYEGGYWHYTIAQVLVSLWAGFMLLVTAMFVRRTREEDGMLRKEFPDQWKEWARRTPYKLVPYVY